MSLLCFVAPLIVVIPMIAGETQAVQAWCIADKAMALGNIPNEVDQCNSPPQWQTRGPDFPCFGNQGDDFLFDLQACCSLMMVPFPRQPSAACRRIAETETSGIPTKCLNKQCWGLIREVHDKFITSDSTGLPALFNRCKAAPDGADCAAMKSSAKLAKVHVFNAAKEVLGEAIPCIPREQEEVEEEGEEVEEGPDHEESEVGDMMAGNDNEDL